MSERTVSRLFLDFLVFWKPHPWDRENACYRRDRMCSKCRAWSVSVAKWAQEQRVYDSFRRQVKAP